MHRVTIRLNDEELELLYWEGVSRGFVAETRMGMARRVFREYAKAKVAAKKELDKTEVPF